MTLRLVVSDEPKTKSAKPRRQRKPREGKYCSFCGRAQHECDVLVAGVAVCICEACVLACQEVVDQTRQKRAASRPAESSP